MTIRITDVQKISLNGTQKTAFKLYKKEWDAFIFDGQFYAPARMPRKDFEKFAADVQLLEWDVAA